MTAELGERERAGREARGRELEGELAAHGVAGVAVTWVDNSGVTRVKAVPTARLPYAAAWGIGASPVFDTFLVDDSMISGRYAGGPVGDLRLHPDLDRLTVLHAQPGWAWAPADRYDTDGAPHPQCHRALARGQTGALAAAGLHARAAFELEWVVSVRDDDRFAPATSGPAYGMTRLVDLSGYLRDVLTALDAEDVRVEQVHPEYATGQFEVSMAAGDPVAAADTLVLVRQTIRAVTARAGLRVSFAPKVLADGVGNGGHLHVSLWRGDKNLMAGGDGPFGLTREGVAFTAGILDRLPALLAIGAPSVASYLRLIPGHWAGAFACWGLENREAALRFVTGVTGATDRAANLEVKCFDGAANPYLLVAGVLAAGRAGVAEGASLPEPVAVDPASLGADERRGRGIAALPADLETSVAAFETDLALREALGMPLIDTVAAVRRGEIALFAHATPEEICARTRWVY